MSIPMTNEQFNFVQNDCAQCGKTIITKRRKIVIFCRDKGIDKQLNVEREINFTKAFCSAICASAFMVEYANNTDCEEAF